MKPKAKGKEPYANWKVTPGTLKRVNQHCLNWDRTQWQLAMDALDALDKAKGVTNDFEFAAASNKPQLIPKPHLDQRQRRRRELLGIIEQMEGPVLDGLDMQLELWVNTSLLTRGKTMNEIRELIDARLDALRAREHHDDPTAREEYGT